MVHKSKYFIWEFTTTLRIIIHLHCTTHNPSAGNFVGTVVSSGRMLTMRACRGTSTPPGNEVPAGKYLTSASACNLSHRPTDPPYLSTVISGRAAPSGSILSSALAYNRSELERFTSQPGRRSQTGLYPAPRYSSNKRPRPNISLSFSLSTASHLQTPQSPKKASTRLP